MRTTSAAPLPLVCDRGRAFSTSAVRNGEFLAAAKENGFDAIGVDVSETTTQLCRARGLEALAGDLLTITLPRSFDVATTWDVIEHLQNPLAFAQRAVELIRPRGYLFIKTPYVSDMTFRLAALLPRLANPLLQTPAHIQFFTPNSLSRLVPRQVSPPWN